MTKKKADFVVDKPNFLVAAALAISALVVGVHVFITYVVFPAAERFMSIYIPARSGGRTYYVSDNEFQATSMIILGAAALFLIAILLLVATRKYLAAFLISLLYTTLAVALYSTVMLGNGFDELWGGGWSVLGVMLSIALYSGITILIVMSRKGGLAGTLKSK